LAQFGLGGEKLPFIRSFVMKSIMYKTTSVLGLLVLFLMLTVGSALAAPVSALVFTTGGLATISVPENQTAVDGLTPTAGIAPFVYTCKLQ
jgi:hypothetical protein